MPQDMDEDEDELYDPSLMAPFYMEMTLHH